MDAESLLLSLELASGSGQGLSPDRRASLLTSLTLVKRDYRYDRVLFWGRILGLNADYYIAQGLSEDQLAPRKTLYRWGRCPDGQRPKGDMHGRVMGAGRGGPRCQPSCQGHFLKNFILFFKINNPNSLILLLGVPLLLLYGIQI